MQRAYEEAAQKKMSAILSRRTLSTVDPGRFSVKIWPRHITPPGTTVTNIFQTPHYLILLRSGGIWVRLEGEWRDANNLPQPQRLNNRQRGKTTRIN